MELIRWTLAEHFGWTLKEVDSLSMNELAEWFQIDDGRAKARAEIKGDERPLGRRRQV